MDMSASLPGHLLANLRSKVLCTMCGSDEPSNLCMTSLNPVSIDCSCLDFIMNLTRLKTLQLKLDSRNQLQPSHQMQVGKLSQLREHHSLQEVHLLGLPQEAELRRVPVASVVPFTKSACSFFGMRQLKVLSMAYTVPVEVASCLLPSLYSSEASMKLSGCMSDLRIGNLVLCLSPAVTGTSQTHCLGIQETAVFVLQFRPRRTSSP